MALDPQVPEGIEVKSILRSGLHLAEETYSKIFPKAILLEKKAKWVWDVSNKHSENQWGFWPKEKFQWMKSKLKNYTESVYEQDSGIHLIAFLSLVFIPYYQCKKKKKKSSSSSCTILFTPIPSSKTIAFCVNVRGHSALYLRTLYFGVKRQHSAEKWS